MKLDKAIEILTDWGVISEPQVDQDLLDSVKLGIEALKRHRFAYALSYENLLKPLPGETEGDTNEHS